jgi:UDP-N-acetylglucosamine 4,6-dehydratase
MDTSYRTIVITGGTGSLGQALTQHLLTTLPTVTIRVLSRGEHRQAEMMQRYGTAKIRYLLGDVRDYPRLLTAFHGADAVIHAAALKRQDMLEYNVYEGVATNVIGTRQVVQACADAGVHHCVFISSDKAVNSCTTYGSTKAIGESLTIQANAYSPHGTRYNVVRWGNVAASQGSVIPFWGDCLRRGKPLPVTDLSATRFWIDLAQAVATVAGVLAQPTRGMVYVPHLPAFRIEDLALAMIRQDCGFPMSRELLSAHITVIGPRAYEKKDEALMTTDEQQRALWLEALQCYVIPPLAQSWEAPPFVGDGPMSIAEPYRSDVWPERLDVEALRTRVESLVCADAEKRGQV